MIGKIASIILALMILLFRNPSNHLGCINPVNNGITRILAGAGFLPSTGVPNLYFPKWCLFFWEKKGVLHYLHFSLWPTCHHRQLKYLASLVLQIEKSISILKGYIYSVELEPSLNAFKVANKTDQLHT